jgi:hypothetical protein
VVNLNFIRTANRSYTIQYAVTPTGPWQKLTDVAATAITGAISVPDTSVTTNSARFYKLVTPDTRIALSERNAKREKRAKLQKKTRTGDCLGALLNFYYRLSSGIRADPSPCP